MHSKRNFFVAKKQKEKVLQIYQVAVAVFGVVMVVVLGYWMVTRAFEDKPALANRAAAEEVAEEAAALEEAYHVAEEVAEQAPLAGPPSVAYGAGPINPAPNTFGCPDRAKFGARKGKGSNNAGEQPNCQEMYDGIIHARSETGPYVAYMWKIKEGGAHAASLVELEDGTLLYAWFAGREGKAGVVIVVSRLPQGGRRWSKPAVVSQFKGRSCQNPVLFLDSATQRVWLFHTAQEGGKGQGTAFVASLTSIDKGKTWTEAEVDPQLSSGGPFVKGKLLVAQNGDWLLPMYYTPVWLPFSTHYSTMRRGPPGGQWASEVNMTTQGQMLAQPSVVRQPGTGHLQAFFRDRSAENIYTSVSTDDGLTWPPNATRTELPNNNSGIQVIYLRNGKLVLAFNNRQGLLRWPLSLALSEDGGATWPFVRDVEQGGDDDVLPHGERIQRYSYPSLIQTQDDRIHVGYTYRRQTMKHVVVDEGWIKEGGTIGVFKGSAVGEEK